MKILVAHRGLGFSSGSGLRLIFNFLSCKFSFHSHPCTYNMLKSALQVCVLTCVGFQAGSGECSCGGTIVKGMCVKPTKGDAVLFWSMVSFPKMMR